MFYYTYKITCLCEPYKNHYYLGQRSCQTLPDKRYAGSGTNIINYFKTYGKVEGLTYTKEIINFYNNADELNKAEFELIGDKYKTDNFCMNLCEGGHSTRGHKLTDDQKKLISEATKEAMKNIKIRNKISEAHKGKPSYKLNEEQRKQASERMKLNNPMKNKETSKKVSEKLKGHKPAEKSIEGRQRLSERMKLNNPMKNKETAKKVSETKRNKNITK